MEDIKNLPEVQNNESEKGANLVEYALLIALIAIVCIVALNFLSESVSSTFVEIGSAVKST